MSTKALIGKGTTLSIGATPTLVAEIKSIKYSGYKRAMEDASNMDSANVESIPGLLDPGEIEIAGNYIGADAGQVAIRAALEAATLSDFTVTYPKGTATTAPKETFSGYVIELSRDFDATKSSSFSAKIKLNTIPVLTAGA